MLQSLYMRDVPISIIFIPHIESLLKVFLLIIISLSTFARLAQHLLKLTSCETCRVIQHDHVYQTLRTYKSFRLLFSIRFLDKMMYRRKKEIITTYVLIIAANHLAVGDFVAYTVAWLIGVVPLINGVGVVDNHLRVFFHWWRFLDGGWRGNLSLCLLLSSRRRPMDKGEILFVIQNSQASYLQNFM